jgi:hypothetical protein
MADAHRRRFDAVVVWKFDRFARSVSHLLRALETFRAQGIEFVSFTERHYNPWVRSRQEQLEGDVASAWKRDPVLNRKTESTNSVQLQKGPVN